jgi:hypothetical protein
MLSLFVFPLVTLPIGTPPVLRDEYEFTCCVCAQWQTMPPSINMQGGINSAVRMCLHCKTVLHITIFPDLEGETCVSERQSTFIARRVREERLVRDGGNC